MWKNPTIRIDTPVTNCSLLKSSTTASRIFLMYVVLLFER